MAGSEFRYSPEEQQALLDVAAYLQRSEPQSLNRDEVISAAEEAGIESRFILKAIALKEEGVKKEPIDVQSSLVLVLLLAVQTAIAYSFFKYDFARWNSAEVAVAPLLCLALGVWKAPRRNSIYESLGFILLSIAVGWMIALLISAATLSPAFLGNGWQLPLIKGTLIQIGFTLLGWIIGSVRLVSKQAHGRKAMSENLLRSNPPSV